MNNMTVVYADAEEKYVKNVFRVCFCGDYSVFQGVFR